MSEQKNNEVGLNEELVIEILGREVANEAVLSEAKKVIQTLADTTGEVTLLDMVVAFDQVTALREFSSKLRKAALSGTSVPEFWGAIGAMARHHQKAEA